jgi:putative transposase
MDWKQLLAYITGSVDQELLVCNAYLVTENRILCQQITGHVRLSDGERKTLARLGKRLGRQALAEVATIVTPETILAWHRRLVAKKFDGSPQRKTPGRPPVDAELEALVVRLAQENRSWGYDRIVGALKHLGYAISDQTVGNILKRHGIPPAPKRKRTTTWQEFIRTHLDVLVAMDFFTTEVWTVAGLVIYYVLFFMHLAKC